MGSRQRTPLRLLISFANSLAKSVVKCKRSASTGHLKSWTFSDLPKGCNIDDIFRLIISPTYHQMLSHHKQPFSVPDEDDLVAMQAIFSHIYQAYQEYTVMTQLHEVEVRELKPKYKVEVMKYEFYYLSRTPKAMVYHSRTFE